MLFDDNRVCTGCGRTTFTRHTCPFCPCNYCKKNGHIADNCTKAQKSKKRSRPVASLADGNPASGGPLSNPFSTTPRKNRRLLPPRHHADVPAGSSAVATSSDGAGTDETLDPEIVALGSVAIVLPLPEPLTGYILRKLLADGCPLHLKQYKGKIQKYGGSEKVLADAMKAVDSHVQDLQGKEVTPQRLREIERSQNRDLNLFHPDGGYLDFITDSRCPFYCRLYVGQASILEDRIGCHIEKMERRDESTLHYYVKSKGGRHRKANFIRIFHFDRRPDTHIDQDGRNMLKNILELSMCAAFQTLPKEELLQWLPHGSSDVRYRTVHLNVLNPLLQDSFINDHLRHTTRSKLTLSMDPEVRQWPQVRANQLSREKPKSPYVPPPRLSDYEPALNDAIRKVSHPTQELFFNAELEVPSDASFDLDTCVSSIRSDMSDFLGIDISLWKPFGSLTSRVAIVLNQISAEKGSTPSTSGEIQDLPYGLREMGFNAENVLIWPFNLHQSDEIRPSQISEDEPIDEIGAFEDFSLSLIAASSARFVLVSEGTAQRYIFDQSLKSSASALVTLRGYDISIRLMLDGARVHRVFVLIPNPEKLTSVNNWKAIQKFSQIIRMATYLTGVKSINHSYFENNRSYGLILRMVVAERDGGEPVTLSTLDEGLRQWLSRKGFRSDDDLNELLELTGSLSQAVFLLMCSLPKYHRGRPSIRPDQKKVIQAGRRFPKELLDKVRGLRQRKVLEMLDGTREDENLPDELPEIARIQEQSYQGLDLDEELDEREDHYQESVEKIELSLASTGVESNSGSSEIVFSSEVQHPHQFTSTPEGKASNLRGWKPYHDCRRETYLDRLLNGGSFKPVRRRLRNTVEIAFAKIRINVPAKWDLRGGKDVEIMAELAAAGSEHSERFALHSGASAMARRLAFRLSGITWEGKTFVVWPSSKSPRQAKAADELAKDVESAQKKKQQQQQQIS